MSTASYVVVAGDALSSIASRHGVSLDELVAANDWPDGAAHLIVPGDSIRLPGDATPPRPTTAPAATTPTTAHPNGAPLTTAATDDAVVGHYVALGTQYGGPDVGAQTLPIIEPLVDGIYEADAVALNDPSGSITFALYQVLYGDACTAVYGTDEDSCLDGYGITGGGTTTAPFDMTNGTVTVITPLTIESYSIDIAEFQRLLAGRPAATDAPVDFQYTPFPFTVTVRDGIVVAADQHYVS